jgi:CheY-like chemotaxis protein
MQNSALKLRVLVVDDEFVIASTWSQILRMSGFETEMATSGEEAIGKATRWRPDVLLSDVMMRGISGIETASAILKFHPECRVILISGQAETARSMAEDYPGKPDFEILRKPIHPLILLDQIRETMQPALARSA